MAEENLLQRLDELVLELGCDYDRFSTSGQKTYAELCSTVNNMVMEANQHEDKTIQQQETS